MDALLHNQIARGSVNFSLKLDRDSTDADVKINVAMLKGYVSALKDFEANNPEFRCQPGTTVDFLRLPGVICDRSSEQEGLPELLWNAIENNVGAAIEKLQDMRRADGASTATYLSENIELLRASIGEIKALAPKEVESYRERLTERVSKILAENGATLDPADVIREIAIFTDKADISEEISRFYSHLDQFDSTMESEATCGKKLDFLTQEMFRETNTIGSKANSPDVLQRVVEMKSTIERVREMVQNVE
ncbi:MAG: DUF1732 domain-containing protein [Thermoguttaceae bacterium]|nr:DUF1732 domain-containing protein [Thermoguttaceae bacterium]